LESQRSSLGTGMEHSEQPTPDPDGSHRPAPIGGPGRAPVTVNDAMPMGTQVSAIVQRRKIPAHTLRPAVAR
jgi:hypothetical protein